MNSRISKIVVCLLTTIVVVSLKNCASAQCVPGLLGCWGRWTVVAAYPEAIEEPVKASGSVGATKGCSYYGEMCPEVTCDVRANQTDVIDWNVSGSLTARACKKAGIAIGANVGGSRTYNYGADAGVKIFDFCQTCRSRVVLDYTKTDYFLKCSCSFGREGRGAVTKFDGHHVQAKSGNLLLWCDCEPECNPPCKPCNPNCPDPPSGG